MSPTARRSALTLLTVILAAGSTACDSIFGPGENTLLREQLAESERIWQQRAVSHYRMVVARGALYAEGYRSVVLEVRNGQIISAAYADDETPVEPDVLAEHQTVPQLFNLVRSALDRRAPAIFVRYDDEYGFPNLIQIDFDVTRFGNDVYVAVSDFEPVGT
jgi:hypothetical protein